MTTEQQPRRPIPPDDPDLTPFWEGCRRHEFLLQRCKKCSHYIWHPRAYCGNCQSDDTEWVTAKGTGTVYSYTIVYQAAHPFFSPQIPYVVAYIELDEGIQVMSNLIDVDPAKVEVGMPVEVTFEDVNDEFSVYLFHPKDR